MTAIRGIGTARLAGFLLGAALAATLVLASRPASGGDAVGASIGFSANQTGELAIDPAGPTDFLHAAELRAGGSARGSCRMRNQTGRREAVRLRLVPSSHELDRSLSVEISSEGRILASGPLGSLAHGAGDPIVLAPGQSATIAVTVSVPAGADRQVAAALVEVAVDFETGALETNGGIAA